MGIATRATTARSRSSKRYDFGHVPRHGTNTEKKRSLCIESTRANGRTADALAILSPVARPKFGRASTHGTVTLTGFVAIIVATALPPATPSEGSSRIFSPSRPAIAQCEGQDVPRPSAGECVDFRDVSPYVDPGDGAYRAGLDRGNWVTAGEGTLELLAIHVIDNGEGDSWPHGPHGNLFFDFFLPDEPTDVSRDGAHHRRVTTPRALRGPHRTHGFTDEWLDDELLTFRDAGLFRWGSSRGTEDEVVMRIYETDSHAEDGFLGRRNDVMGMARIDRAASERPEGVWVTFHSLTNDHPRRTREAVAVRALVRTRGPEEPESAATVLARACAGGGAGAVARRAPASLCAPFERAPVLTARDPAPRQAEPAVFPATLLNLR
jgi:hypothetical protein